MPSKPITMDAVYTAPGYLFRRMQQIAVALFVEECKAFDLTAAPRVLRSDHADGASSSGSNPG